MKCSSWNVNGIRALARKDRTPWRVLSDSDVICLQETKADISRLTRQLASPRGWHAHWHGAERPGYSGTAIICRDEPDEVLEGIGVKKYDAEGRVLGVRFGELVILSAYFPNSQAAGVRLPYKLGFCRALLRFLARLRDERGLRIVLTGDYNIAHRPIDLARPKQNERNPGYLPEERAWMTRFLAAGFHDVFRERHPELEGAYTWWTMRTDARARNLGWRLDYTVVSQNLQSDVRKTTIHARIGGSDHCPVSLEL